MRVAKLVYFESVVRVLVDEELDEDQVADIALEKMKRELEADDVTHQVDDQECPYGTFTTDYPKCPVCNRKNISRDTEPGTIILACDDCGSEFYDDYTNEVTLDARDELSPQEIEKRGWNPKL
jgi:ribosomal protein L37AE/L43A